MRRGPDPLTRALDLGIEDGANPRPTAGSANVQIEMCNLLSLMITDGINSGRIRSRHDLAARMNEALGEDLVTKTMIDSWTAESKDRHRFPYEYGPAFEIALDDDRLQELYARKTGRRTHVGRQAAHEEIGRLQDLKDQIVSREKQLRKELRGKK